MITDARTWTGGPGGGVAGTWTWTLPGTRLVATPTRCVTARTQNSPENKIRYFRWLQINFILVFLANVYKYRDCWQVGTLLGSLPF